MRNEGSLPESFRYARAVEIAARQWGNITTAQLRAIGFSKGAIANMVERGLLHPRHRGVFTFGARSPAPEQRWAAALLAAGGPGEHRLADRPHDARDGRGLHRLPR